MPNSQQASVFKFWSSLVLGTEKTPFEVGSRSIKPLNDSRNLTTLFLRSSSGLSPKKPVAEGKNLAFLHRDHGLHSNAGQGFTAMHFQCTALG
jgi:hypothetical protein